MAKHEELTNEALASAIQSPDVTITERGADNPFSSGSRGYHVSGKIVLNGKRYQLSAPIVEIGSKPAAK